MLTKRLPPGVEADTRRRLADTLDVLGRSSEAAAERESILAIISENPHDAKTQQARGDLLKRKHQYDEACKAYTQALERTPAVNKTGRALIMAKLAHANYDAGRPAQTVIWAEISLTSQPQPNIREAMERLCGVGYADQSDLEKAEYHYKNALRLAEAAGNLEEISKDLSILAGIQHKRGQFQEAIIACHKARKVFAGVAQTSYTVESECLRDLGQFDEARSVMNQCRLVLNYDQPHLKRRMLALSAFRCAGIEVRADQPEAALMWLEQARSGFEPDVASLNDVWPPPPQQGDDKLLLWCDALKSLALAQRGNIQESRLMREDVKRRLLGFTEDRSTGLGVYSSLGRSAFVLGDLAESKELLTLWLDCQPYPVGLASANYWLGETYLRLAETNAARGAFQKAVPPGIDSLDARRAQARLDEMGG